MLGGAVLALFSPENSSRSVGMRSRAFASLVVFASALACGDLPPPSVQELSTEGFSLALCEPSGYLSVEGLAPAAAVDVIEFRRRPLDAPDTADDVLSQVGSACRDAADAAACRARFRDTRADGGFRVVGNRALSLAAMRGEDITLVDSNESMLSFFGPINTGQEAVLLAFAHGYDVACSVLGRGAVRGYAEGYDVIATEGSGCGEGNDFAQVRLAITPEGGVEVLERVVLTPARPNCTP